MSTFDSKDSGKPATSGSSSNKGVFDKSAADWAAFAPAFVSSGDRLDPTAADKKWSALYSAIGMASGSEDEKKAVRCAAYMYGLKNGTSPKASYEGEIKTSFGKLFQASVIASSIEAVSVRRLYRSVDYQKEAYGFLKHSGAVEKDTVLQAKAAHFGVPVSTVFATADFLAGCSLLTATELNLHERTGTQAIAKATISRGGKSVEEERDDGIIQSMRMQENAGANGREISF